MKYLVKSYKLVFTTEILTLPSVNYLDTRFVLFLRRLRKFLSLNVVVTYFVKDLRVNG
jgi:hypothetical protein